MANPQIREYRSEDKAACMAIFESNLPQYFVEEEREQFEDWLDKEDREVYYVLLDDDELVACGGIYEDPELNIVGLAWGMVLNSLHRKGYGKILTLHRVKEMDARFSHLDQHLGTSQHTAPFYEKMGFRTTEVIQDGFGPGLHHFKMMKSATKASQPRKTP